jgi:hypothetical protein
MDRSSVGCFDIAFAMLCMAKARQKASLDWVSWSFFGAKLSGQSYS